MISPLAYIDPEAKIGNNVEIGPFCFIDKNVVIGDNNVIMANVNILYGDYFYVEALCKLMGTDAGLWME